FVALAIVLTAGAVVFGRRAPRIAVLLALGAALAAALRGGPHPSAARDSVVLVVVDTLRADMLDRTRPNGEPVMPRLRALAATGVRFTTAVAPSPWTLPSTTTIVSGMNPFRHGVGRLAGAVPMPGNPAVSYLGPALRRAGYQV